MTWQKWARLVIAVGAVAFAIVVALGFRKGTAPSGGRVTTSDPKALIESSEGSFNRTNRSHEDVHIQYKHLTGYDDGSSKLDDLLVTTTRANGRQFRISAKEGVVSKNETDFVLTGNVRVEVSDGMLVHTEHATYTDKDGMVRAPGPVDVTRGRMRGSSIGMTYDKTVELISLLDHVQLHMAPDERGDNAMEIAAPSATFNRNDKSVQFDNGLTSSRGRQTIAADKALAHLTDDEDRLQAIELHGNAKIAGTEGGVGGLRGISGRDINLKYGPDGQSIQHALVVGDAFIQLASEQGHAGRQIGANLVDMSLAPDGSTPTALTASDGVELAFPPEPATPGRIINAQHLDSTGDERKGLTAARFDGNVSFREKGPDIDRQAKSQVLEVTLEPGMGAIDEAHFTRSVRFEDGEMEATAADARYVLDKGLLDLSSAGAAPAGPPPHVDTKRIGVDAPTISITLDGPVVAATGSVKSVLKHQTDSGGKDATKTPTMLKKDQDVIVTADTLDYDGNKSQARYKGRVRLTQGDTSINSLSMTIDDKTGDLTAGGETANPVVTSMVREEPGSDQKMERVRSDAKATDMKYVDAQRELDYAGAAHMFGPSGDMTADKIDLYLKESGDEIDRVEAFTKVTLKETSGRTTTGERLTYTSADEQYLVLGQPVHVTEACGRTTTGQALTLSRLTDRITVTGSDAGRTQTVGSSANCS